MRWLKLLFLRRDDLFERRLCYWHFTNLYNLFNLLDQFWDLFRLLVKFIHIEFGIKLEGLLNVLIDFIGWQDIVDCFTILRASHKFGVVLLVERHQFAGHVELGLLQVLDWLAIGEVLLDHALPNCIEHGHLQIFGTPQDFIHRISWDALFVASLLIFDDVFLEKFGILFAFSG